MAKDKDTEKKTSEKSKKPNRFVKWFKDLRSEIKKVGKNGYKKISFMPNSIKETKKNISPWYHSLLTYTICPLIRIIQ